MKNLTPKGNSDILDRKGEIEKAILPPKQENKEKNYTFSKEMLFIRDVLFQTRNRS